MNYNIIDEYIKYIKKSFSSLFKIVFKDAFKKSFYVTFLDKYISVRYYDETNYHSEKDFIKRINRELVDIYGDIIDEDNVDDLKNMIAFFAYVVYFDDILIVEKDMEIINSLINDSLFNFENKDELKQQIKDWYIRFKEGKERFNNAIETKYFNVVEEKLCRNLSYLVLEHNVKISNLYSEYAINKVYTTGIINEDKLFITYILASHMVLNNAINLDFSRKYMVPIASSLFEKEKKFVRLINILNNPLAKNSISIRITYTDYISNKNKIDKLINEGYSFGLEIDEKYSGNLTELILFPYVLIDGENEYYEMFIANKDVIRSKIIKI